MKKLILAAVPTVLLSACGGNDPWDITPTPCGLSFDAPYGFFSGKLGNGQDVRMLILDNGLSWTLYGYKTSSNFLVYGLAKSTGDSYDSSSKAYTASSLNNYSFGAKTSGSYNLAFTTSAGSSAGSAAGNVIYSTGSPGLSVTINNASESQCFYDTPATAATAAGSWVGKFSDTGTGDNVSFSISGDTITSASGYACTFSNAKITPRASGKNVYDVSLTTGTSCSSSPNTTFAGQAIITTPSNATKPQMTAMLQSSDSSKGGTLFLQQQ